MLDHNKVETLPLSFAQERLWLLQQRDPQSVAYNRPTSFRLRGPLHFAAFEASLNEVISRHEVLRIRVESDRPLQRVVPPQFHCVSVTDLSHLPEGEQHQAETRLAIVEASKPFCLNDEPPVRFRLLRLGAEHHLLLLTLHHIAFDGWSERLFLRDLTTLYEAHCRGSIASLENLTTTYSSITRLQRARLPETTARDTQYWRDQLSDVPPPLALPTDCAKQSGSDAGGSVPIEFSAELTAMLRSFSQRHGTTLFTTVLAGFEALLYRYTRQEDFIVGVPMANRLEPGSLEVIGLFINTLPVRANLRDNPTFLELLARVRQSTIAAYGRQNVPLQQIIEELSTTASGAALFRTLVNLQPATEDVTAGGLTFSRVRTSTGVAKLDLSVDLFESRDRLCGDIEYKMDLFSFGTISTFAAQFKHLLRAAVSRPELRVGEIPIAYTYAALHGEETPTPAEALQHDFENHAKSQPAKPAIVFGDTCWTYAELDQRANQIANWLRSRDDTNCPVAIVAKRSPEMIASMLGTLKGGRAYVPLDARLPAVQKQQILAETDAILLTTHRHLADVAPLSERKHLCLERDRDILAGQSTVAPAAAGGLNDLAYVIYTSGTTGQPRGVQVEHHSAVNFSRAAVEEYGLAATDRVLQFASIGFDASVEEIFGCWVAGATLVLREEDAISTPDRFLRLLDEQEITFCSLPTAYWHELSRHLAKHPSQFPKRLETVVLGGEKVQPSAVDPWWMAAPQSCRLFNTYGPTEATVVSTVHEIERSANSNREVPLGHPIRNTHVYVVEPSGDLAAIGIPGELCIAGRGVARGYLNQAETTRERFISCPFDDPSRMYRTGDRVRLNAEGELIFLGRMDNQLKIRGFRVEPDGVAACLERHPQVRQCAVVATSVDGDLEMAACLVADSALTQASIRRFARAVLPDFMVPAEFHFLPELPRNHNDKVDLRRWVEQRAKQSRDAAEPEFVEPRSDMEVALLQIWQDVLGHDRFGIHEDFFELGGHSLKATQVATRIQEKFAVQIRLQDLFRLTTVADLASHLSTLTVDNAAESLGSGSSLRAVAAARRRQSA